MQMFSKKDRVSKLGQVRLFKELSKSDLKELEDIGRVVEHAAGHTIIDQGESGAGFHMILGGEVKVVRGGRTVARLGPGEAFGEMALIDGGPRTATVVAETETTTFAIATWDFRALVKKRPGMSWSLLLAMTERLREAQRKEDEIRA
jgi:CRP-like cAMP-binding protein